MPPIYYGSAPFALKQGSQALNLYYGSTLISGGAVAIADPRFALVGDSLTMYNNGVVGLNAVSLTRDAAGVVTVNKAGHGIYGNQPVYIVNCSDTSYEAAATSTYIDANNFSYPTGVTGLAGSITGGVLTQACILNRYSEDGIWMWLQGAFSGGLRNLGIFGQGGDRLDELNNANALACATAADFVILEGGINDITGGATSTTVISRAQAQVNTILAAGKKAILLGITPYGSAFNSPARNTEVLASNVGYAAIAAANPSNVLFANAHSDLTDGTSNNVAYTWATSDGIHWTRRAARLIAARVQTAINSMVTTSSILPTGSADLPNVLGYTAIKQYGPWSATGGGFAGTGVSGTVAPRLQIFASNAATASVCSLVDRGADGYWQRCVITPGGANHAVTFYLQANAGETLASLGLVSGDTVYLEAEISVSGAVASGLLGFIADIRSQASGTFGIANAGKYDTSGAYQIDTYQTVVVTGELAINASFTSLLSTLGIRFAAASASPLTLDIGRITLYKKNP